MKQNAQINWGWLLVGLGVLFLLENLGLNVMGWVWGLVFAAGGAGFLWFYQQDRERWWALIPGFTLLGLGVLILLEPLVGGDTGGGIFLGAIGLGFLAVYFTRRDFWWAIIPGGTLLTLAVVASSGSEGDSGGFLFFLGLALTFGVLFLMGQRWAIFPAGGCAVLMLFTATALEGMLGYVFPLALLGVGVYLLTRDRGRAPKSPELNPGEGLSEPKVKEGQ